MDTQHPDWCTPTACTAYGVEGADNRDVERWHRSEPFLVATSDPTIGLCVHKFAEADGTDEHIELTMVTLPTTRAWYLAEPVQSHTMLIQQQTAAALARAVAHLV